MKPILEIHDLSKRFKIRHEIVPYLTIRESIINLLKFRKTTSSEEIWALHHVTLNINEGESIGIIGKNGAGKSTLLKILSRITLPTSGKIITRGRIASLLEVGTGFHPELTGRENIFLNGSILGMLRKEIVRKFDAIVDFAGVELFLDTPLKHYSSGMQLRLAFAVAAFLEPEILIIDEVLAVGDVNFQKKCIGKMEDVNQSGRTIIFVSHQMGLVSQLCSRCILLDNGKVLTDGKTGEVIDKYLSLNLDELGNKFIANPAVSKQKELYIAEAFTVQEDATPASHFGYFEPVCLHLKVHESVAQNDVLVSVALLDKFGNRIFTALKPLVELSKKDNFYIGTLKIPGGFIAPNTYSFHFALAKADGKIYDIHEGECRFTITDTGSPFAMFDGKDYGTVIISCSWI